MAHEILSVKMYELDKKLEQTHSRIQLAESMDTERLHQQIQNLRQECQESYIVWIACKGKQYRKKRYRYSGIWRRPTGNRIQRPDANTWRELNKRSNGQGVFLHFVRFVYTR